MRPSSRWAPHCQTATSHLPVSKLKVSEVLEQGWVQLSQASLYRAVESGRFYCVTPAGRSIGKEFPAWQFVPPVPELIAPVLAMLAGQPNSDIHAFFVSSADALNELSPAEMLAGKPFETRSDLHPSQQALLDLPARERLQQVIAAANGNTRVWPILWASMPALAEAAHPASDSGTPCTARLAAQ